jgi:hypothetical protein
MERNLVGEHAASGQLLNDIMEGLRMRYASLNGIHYEAAWTDSWCDCRCMHAHQTLSDAAECGLPRAAGWYVLAIEGGELPELTASENKIVNEIQFASWKTKS